MDLLKNIRADRARQKKKQSYRSEVFNTVSCIVKGYGLGSEFLKLLDKSEDYLVQLQMEFAEVKSKRIFEFPPFSLVSQEEYRLVMIIVGKLDNPYLLYAHSPEEILISASLYEANPALRSEDLLHNDFESLLLCQCAKDELMALERCLENGECGGASQNAQLEEYGREPSHLSMLRERIKQLQTFITKIENTEPQLV